MEGINILILDVNSDFDIGNSLREVIEGAETEYGVIRAEHAYIPGQFLSNTDLREVISKFHPHMAVLVLSFEACELPLALLRDIKKESFALPIIAALERDNPDEMIKLLKLGVADFITPPFKSIDVVPRIWRILRHRAKEKDLTHTLKERIGLRQLVGECPGFVNEINKIPSIARCDASVLITGETGTGKELCARAIHYLSTRAGKAFIPVNCGAIPVDLVENELFGHTRGAYTGADSQQDGLISEAEGGTIFLDEIDCLPLASQVKLLRLLQERVYRKIGSPKSHTADVRVISATNIDLEEAIEQGKFRKDLYYRVNIIPITLPPLRERKADIPLLAHHFLQRHCREFSVEAMDFSPEAILKLLAYDWPGNVRELDNVIERSVVLAKKCVISSFDVLLPETIPNPANESFQKAKAIVIQEFERSYIRNCLMAYNGNISRAARAAGKNRRAFWQLIRKHHITV